MDNINKQDLYEKSTGSREVFNGRILHVFEDDVVLPDGLPAKRELIRHVGAVCILPLTDDGMVIMEHQFRYVVDRVLLEIPAGKLNNRNENRLEAAKREFQEETGMTADRWTDLGLFFPAPAYSDEAITLYLAEGLHHGVQNLDPDEFLTVDTIPLKDLLDAVMKGDIPDAKTQLAILKVARLKNIY